MLAPACVTPMNSLPAPLVSHAPPQRPLPPSPFAQPLARRVASPTCLQAITSAQHLLQRLIDSQDLPLPHNVASQLPSVSHCQQSVPLSLDQVQVPNLAQAIPYFQGLLAAQRSALYQPDETAAMPLRHAGSNYACMAAELAAQSCTGRKHHCCSAGVVCAFAGN